MAIMFDGARKSVKYIALSNKHLKTFMLQLRERYPMHSECSASYGSSDNNLGNQLEHVVWIAFEADNPAIFFGSGMACALSSTP